MEKIQLNLEEGRLHLSLNLPEERYEAMMDTVKYIIKNARDNGIVSDAVDEDGDLGTQINGIKLLNMLLNDVAQTEIERIYLAVMFDSFISVLRLQIH
jgi:hypothetical protein